jgi:hypothetical protein
LSRAVNQQVFPKGGGEDSFRYGADRALARGLIPAPLRLALAIQAAHMRQGVRIRVTKS